jgi:hypothetical protein
LLSPIRRDRRLNPFVPAEKGRREIAQQERRLALLVQHTISPIEVNNFD